MVTVIILTAASGNISHCVSLPPLQYTHSLTHFPPFESLGREHTILSISILSIFPPIKSRPANMWRIYLCLLFFGAVVGWEWMFPAAAQSQGPAVSPLWLAAIPDRGGCTGFVALGWQLVLSRAPALYSTHAEWETNMCTCTYAQFTFVPLVGPQTDVLRPTQLTKLHWQGKIRLIEATDLHLTYLHWTKTRNWYSGRKEQKERGSWTQKCAQRQWNIKNPVNRAEEVRGKMEEDWTNGKTKAERRVNQFHNAWGVFSSLSLVFEKPI